MALWGLDIIIAIVLIILLFIFIALPLYLTTRMMDEDKGLLVALGTTLLLLITFSLCIGIFILFGLCIVGFAIAVLVNLLIIKTIYDVDWGQAFVIWIIAIIMAIVITVIVIVIAGVSLFALLAL